VGVLLILFAASMASAACHEGMLKRVVRDQDETAPFVLVLVTGERYRLYGQDFIDPRDWRSGDQLEICSEESGPVIRITDERLHEVLVGHDLEVGPARALDAKPRPTPSLSVSGSEGGCPVERAKYVLRGTTISAKFTPRRPTQDWPTAVEFSIHSDAPQATYVFLPYEGNGQGIVTHLASVENSASPPAPDEKTGRPPGDLDYLVADPSYQFDQQFRPVPGARAPAHVLIPGLQEALHYRAGKDHKQNVPLAFFDLVACGS
jgi:hypothetical protein